MANDNRQCNRNERQRQINMELSVLPTFTPLNDYQIYHINRATSPMLLSKLIELARKTTRFTIDTEQDYYTHEPALIQIEFIQSKSIVLLVETCHLPHPSSVLFWLIRSLFKVIFKSSNVIYSWGDGIRELTDFIHYNLFSLHTIHQIKMINLPVHFKQWYNKTFLHQCAIQSFGDDDDDHQLCTCLYRPVKHMDHQWSLQKAIAYTFNEFLDKSRTKSHWSRPLNSTNIQQYSIINKNAKKIHEHLILYAANDCLAVTKLLMVLESNWSKEQLEQYNQNQQ